MANSGRTHLQRRDVLAIALAILTGIALSVWLAVDSPTETPARPSYLPE